MRSIEEQRDDAVMVMIEILEGSPETVGYGELLGHLYDCHQFRDSFVYRDLVNLYSAFGLESQIHEMQTCLNY